MDQLYKLRIETLEEYKRLLLTFNHINDRLVAVNRDELPGITATLRNMERRLGLVMTSFKSAVYGVHRNFERDLQRKALDIDRGLGDFKTNRPEL
ncbi:hypothetical protein K502DRAFT_364616 [Neoconidiobolus thromboides FSU 785]|nr:hypothetical protein K502DRAFT_364616 [Neoconidiobolus thromboides FSU 785]